MHVIAEENVHDLSICMSIELTRRKGVVFYYVYQINQQWEDGAMFKTLSVMCITALLVFGVIHLGTAAEFQPLGYDAISMGGAGVASSRGSYTPYYNPALLAKPRHSVEISLSPGIGFREINLVDHIDTLADIDVQSTMDELSNLNYEDIDKAVEGEELTVGLMNSQVSTDVATIKRELRALSVKNGLQIMPNAAFAVQAGNWGIGSYVMAEATAFAVIDDSRLDVIVPHENDGTTYYVKYDEVSNAFTLSNENEYRDTSIDYAVSPENMSTFVKLTGMAYGEVPVSYAQTIAGVPGSLSVGGSLKFMTAKTHHAVIDIDTESEEIGDELEDSEYNDSTWGADLGVLYSPPGLSNLSIGLVGKNLNSPEFRTVGGGTITIDPQVRAGAAMNFFNDSLSVAFDMDLTTNETYIDNYDAQFAGGGVSWHPLSWFSIRGGAMKNLKESEEGLILTAGLGLGLKWFQLDLAGQVSTETGEYDDQEIPRYGRVQLAFISKWN